jgi:hypothetical protein
MARVGWIGMGFVLLAPLMTLIAAPDPVRADERIRAKLRGFEEVPAISSVATAEFRGKINHDETSIDFELSYNNLESAVQQAHIHFGQKSVNGGIVVFLCTNLGNGPAGTPTCPSPSGTVTGTRGAGDMVNAAAAQGIAAGEFAELIRAIRGGVAYANVHTVGHTGGEIRGQIKASHSDDD